MSVTYTSTPSMTQGTVDTRKRRPTSLRTLLQRDHGGQSSILLVFPPGRTDGLPERRNLLFQSTHRAPERLLGMRSQQLLRDGDQHQSVRFSGSHQTVAE